MLDGLLTGELGVLSYIFPSPCFPGQAAPPSNATKLKEQANDENQRPKRKKGKECNTFLSLNTSYTVDPGSPHCRQPQVQEQRQRPAHGEELEAHNLAVRVRF